MSLSSPGQSLEELQRKRLFMMVRALFWLVLPVLLVPLSGLGRPDDHELAVGVLMALLAIGGNYGLALILRRFGHVNAARTLVFAGWIVFGPAVLLLLDVEQPLYVQGVVLSTVVLCMVVTQNTMLALAPLRLARPWWVASMVVFTASMTFVAWREAMPPIILGRLLIVYWVLSVAAAWPLRTILLDLEEALKTSEARRLEAEESRHAAHDAQEAAEAASHAKSRFLTNTSHELRTPLAAIIGYVGLIDDELPGALPETRADLRRIKAAGTHLLGLIDAMLDLAKVEAGHLTLDLQPVKIDELVEEVVATVRPLADEKGLALGTDHGVHHAWTTDRVRLGQILINLVGNAIKYTPTGQVMVRTRAQADEVRIEVRDTGVGIASGDLQRIFDDFERTNAPITQREGGTGLGLSPRAPALPAPWREAREREPGRRGLHVHDPAAEADRQLLVAPKRYASAGEQHGASHCTSRDCRRRSGRSVLRASPRKGRSALAPA